MLLISRCLVIGTEYALLRGVTTKEIAMTLEALQAIRLAKSPKQVLFYGWHVDYTTRRHGWYFQHPCKQEFIGRTFADVLTAVSEEAE